MPPVTRELPQANLEHPLLNLAEFCEATRLADIYPEADGQAQQLFYTIARQARSRQVAAQGEQHSGSDIAFSEPDTGGSTQLTISLPNLANRLEEVGTYPRIQATRFGRIVKLLNAYQLLGSGIQGPELHA